MPTQFGGKGTLQRSREGCCDCEAKKKVKAVLWGERGHLKKRFTFGKKASVFTGGEGAGGSIVCGQEREEGGDIERKKLSP